MLCVVHSASVVFDLEDVSVLISCIADLDSCSADFFGTGVGQEFAHEIQRMCPLLDEVLEDRDLTHYGVHFS